MSASSFFLRQSNKKKLTRICPYWIKMINLPQELKIQESNQSNVCEAEVLMNVSGEGWRLIQCVLLFQLLKIQFWLWMWAWTPSKKRHACVYLVTYSRISPFHCYQLSQEQWWECYEKGCQGVKQKRDCVTIRLNKCFIRVKCCHFRQPLLRKQLMFFKSRFCGDVKPVKKTQNSVALTSEKPGYTSSFAAIWMCKMYQVITWNILI